MSKIYILDTNVLLNDPYSIFSFEEHTVMIPMTVLEELDNIKSRKTDVSRDARVAIRQIEDIVGDADHEEILAGVKMCQTVPGIHKDAGLSIFPDQSHKFDGDYGFLECSSPDNIIINVALYLQSQGKNAVLVSNDINMRLKAKGAGMKKVESYSSERTVTDIDLLPAGYRKFDGKFWETIDNVDTQTIGNKVYHFVDISKVPNDLLVNEYLFDDTEDFLLRYEGRTVDEQGNLENMVALQDIGLHKAESKKAWDITPKDPKQALALHSLMDKDIDLTVLVGPAGTGKTLITMAAALELVFEKAAYDRVIFSRSMQSQFEEIGFLPGNEHEKTAPWCGGAYDALEYLHKNDKDPKGSVDYLMEQNKIQFKALNFIRGRSFHNTILVIDEAQNLTCQQVKTILSRAGDNCKVVMMGNLSQIDNQYVSALSSGLTYTIDKTKEFEGSTVIHLDGIVRSRLAEWVEERF